MEINGKRVRIIPRKKKTQKKKKVIAYDRTPPINDYMKYYKVVRNWAIKNYEISFAELECMFFLYSERLFTYYQFCEYSNIMSWDKKRFTKLQEKGFIQVWRKPGWKEIRLYELTYKGKRMINSIYKKLNGEEPIPVSKRNVIMSRNSYSDKVHAMAILKFNSEFKEREQRLVPV